MSLLKSPFQAVILRIMQNTTRHHHYCTGTHSIWAVVDRI